MQATSAEVEYIKNEKGVYSWEIGRSQFWCCAEYGWKTSQPFSTSTFKYENDKAYTKTNMNLRNIENFENELI